MFCWRVKGANLYTNIIFNILLVFFCAVLFVEDAYTSTEKSKVIKHSHISSQFTGYETRMKETPLDQRRTNLSLKKILPVAEIINTNNVDEDMVVFSSVKSRAVVDNIKIPSLKKDNANSRNKRVLSNEKEAVNNKSNGVSTAKEELFNRESELFSNITKKTVTSKRIHTESYEKEANASEKNHFPSKEKDFVLFRSKDALPIKQRSNTSEIRREILTEAKSKDGATETDLFEEKELAVDESRFTPRNPDQFETAFGLLMLSVQNSVAQLNSVLSVPPDFHDFGGSSECALVLRRTYLDGRRKSVAPPYGGFFNLLKPGKIHHDGPAEEICIRYTDVNLALAEAKRRKGHRTPRTIQSLEPHPTDIGITGELVLETTRILALQFKLSRDEIMNGLPMIDTSRTDIWEICPAHVKPVPCTIERYRSYTGICNNAQHSSWGSTHTPFVRFLPPAYVDGISAPRISVTGGPLPPARVISSHIHPDVDFPSNELSVLVMSWGQFIDHDMTLAAVPRDERDLDFKCCGMPKEVQHPNCMTIDIPPDDPFYSRYGQHCMEFKRLEAGQRPGCTLGPRTHINLDTSPLDANFLYGSTEDLAHKLRLGKGGLMRVWDRFSEYGLKPLLPPMSENSERDCTARPRHLFCFLAGDERVNEQIHLTVLHTLYVRDHNRIAIELGRLNPHWDDERIYHEARHIMAGSVQHITFNEFLPMTVGEEMIHRHNLTLNPEGYWNGYNPDVHMGMSNAFQAAAFRFGHTHIQGMVRRYNKFHEFIGEDPLRTLLRQPYIVYEPGKMDELIGGLINTPAQVYDPFITMEVTNHLFEEPPQPFGMDLIAFNIMRGRETGVPGYNSYREWCGLGRAKTFEELEPVFSNGTALRYSQIYKHPDDIDLWSGGISEYRLPGAMIGPTFACIIARQFDNVRRGDRFWYENSGFPSAFTPEQLQEIRKSFQSKLICENADDIPTIQLYAMRLPHPIYNPRLPCKEIPSIDLRYWQEDPVHGGYTFKK